jgi:hypothetical protein
LRLGFVVWGTGPEEAQQSQAIATASFASDWFENTHQKTDCLKQKI